MQYTYFFKHKKFWFTANMRVSKILQRINFLHTTFTSHTFKLSSTQFYYFIVTHTIDRWQRKSLDKFIFPTHAAVCLKAELRFTTTFSFYWRKCHDILKSGKIKRNPKFEVKLKSVSAYRRHATQLNSLLLSALIIL